MDELTENINIAAEKIARIRQTARQNQAQLMADDPGERPSIQQMTQTVWVNSQPAIGWPVWPPGIIPKLKALLQKAVRRSLQWYIDPIVQQQNAFNQATLQALQQLAQEVAELQKQQAQSPLNE